MKFNADGVMLSQKRADQTINVIFPCGEYMHDQIAELITSKYKDKNLEIEVKILEE